VDLTTNGVRLAHVADAVKANVDLLKVSLDSTRPEIVASITGRGHAYDAAVNAIQWAVAEGVPLGINAVVMRRTVGDLNSTIDYARRLTHGATSPVHLSLLDFYYTPSRREQWLAEFLPTSQVLDILTRSFGPPQTQDRFGCRFYWFDADGLRVRLKDSFGATMRAAKCNGCLSYCQEGVYGVKHSVEGWFTTCPSSREELGVHLGPGLTAGELNEHVDTVLCHVRGAAPQEQSFNIMCATHSLAPRSLPEDVEDESVVNPSPQEECRK
jgi:MoaA/NifB/PqqE/SkfB family radical SAM enzyme